MKYSKVDLKNLPRIAYVGNESLTTSHGTGMMFSRHFEKYPREKIVDIHFREAPGKAIFAGHQIDWYDLNRLHWNSKQITEINRSVEQTLGRPGSSQVYRTRIYDPINIDWNQHGGPPDLIYSTCFSMWGLSFLHHFYRSLPRKVPIIQHFLDLECRDFFDFISLYHSLEPAMVEVWTLTKPIYYVISKFSSKQPKMVHALQQQLQWGREKPYRNYSDNFKTVIIGNIWSGSAYESLRKLWSACQSEIKKLPHINWYGHPRRFQELKYMNLSNIVSRKDRVLRDGGYLPMNSLKQRLSNADLAIVAFSGEREDKPDYAQYSLPSRIGEYCAQGLPIALISSENTEPARIVRENEMGIVLDPNQFEESKTKLINFIKDTSLRSYCGRNSRKYAEKHLDLEKYQGELLKTLLKYSRPNAHTEFLDFRYSTHP